MRRKWVEARKGTKGTERDAHGAATDGFIESETLRGRRLRPRRSPSSSTIAAATGTPLDRPRVIVSARGTALTALADGGCSDVGEGVESLSSESSAMDQTLRPLDVLAGPVGVR